MVSVIIPARKEKYLFETITELYYRRADEIEVIVVMDGPLGYDYKIPTYPRLKVLHNKTPQGLRSCVNDAAEIATGEYIMKIDAHCKIGHNWDKILKSDCEDNWVVIPRRFSLDAPKWRILSTSYCDAMSYMYVFRNPKIPRITGRPDKARKESNMGINIVEDMCFQGSCWFMTKEHMDRIGKLDESIYGSFSCESEEIGLKTHLGPWGGKVMRNKKTWYAHWGKPGIYFDEPEKYGRGIARKEVTDSYAATTDYWLNNRWDKQVHNFEWLVDKFWPLPRWPENWRGVLNG